MPSERQGNPFARISEFVRQFTGLSVGWLVTIIAVTWLVFISLAHVWVNFERHDRIVIRMGYMPVVTNLAAPLLDYATKDGSGVRFESLKFGSFAEMGQALRSDEIQAAFIIAPLSIVLHQQGAGVRVVYIGNRHESTLVYRKDLKVKDFSDLAGKSIAVPMRYSGHNISARQLAEKYGLTGSRLNIVEMNPPDMASALATGALDAYYVGEPFAAQTVRSGHSKILYRVGEVWKNFICNLVLVKREFIDKHPEQVQMLVQGAARSGLWAREHPKEAAEIAAKYWNQPQALVEYALQTPANRIVYDRFVPKEAEIQYLADQMKRFGLLKENSIKGLVDDTFAKRADLEDVTDFTSILHPPHKSNDSGSGK
ncbi:ABC transporter substrate-binding protein [Thermodesulfobacteriota bacterium]